MKPKYLFMIGGLLLLIFSFPANYLYFSAHNLGSVNTFTSMFRQLSVIVSILILLGALSGSISNVMLAKMEPTPFVQYWLAGFVPMLVIALGLAVIVNPHAFFPGDLYPPVYVGARKIKVDLYRELESSPDVVIMGSSRSFTMSPSYIKEKTGFSAFNLAVNSADVGDFYLQSKLLVRSEIPPRVLLIEIHQNSFMSGSYTWPLQPMAMIPYMPWRGALSLFEVSLKDTLGLQSISDSIYSLFLSEPQRQTWTINLDKYGMGIRASPTHEQYEMLLNVDVKGATYNNAYCKQLRHDSKELLEKTIMLAKENGIGVVLYKSPLNFTFYKAAYKQDPEGFNRCRDLLNLYLSSLAKSHPNVYFRDISVYEPISKLREDGYYDAIHLRPKAAEMVIDVLTPEIEAAMAWSLQTSSR